MLLWVFLNTILDIRLKFENSTTDEIDIQDFEREKYVVEEK